LKELTDTFWEEINSQTYQFDRVDREVEEIQKISQGDLLDFFFRNIKNKETRAKISVRQFNKKTWEERTPPKEEINVVHIENVHKFKWGMSLWSSPRSNL